MNGKALGRRVLRSATCNNVIDLSAYRLRRMRVPEHSVFYLNENGVWLDLLGSFGILQIDDIRTPISLRARLMTENPDLVLIDSSISWADPVELIRELDSVLCVPIVMICDDSYRKTNSPILKQAFEAGLHDTLFTPLSRDELAETIHVLLKFRREA